MLTAYVMKLKNGAELDKTEQDNSTAADHQIEIGGTYGQLDGNLTTGVLSSDDEEQEELTPAEQQMQNDIDATVDCGDHAQAAAMVITAKREMRYFDSTTRCRLEPGLTMLTAYVMKLKNAAEASTRSFYEEQDEVKGKILVADRIIAIEIWDEKHKELTPFHTCDGCWVFHC